jgi:large subunit ribosomal protein L18e
MALEMKKNPVKLATIEKLESTYKKERARIWHALARELYRGRMVNVSKIAKLCEKGEACAVPGKVLGGGEILFPVTVAAFDFSQRAREKIVGGGGECLSLEELMEKNPKGSGVKILGG